MNHLALHYEMPLLPVVKFPLDAQQIKCAYMAGNQKRQGMQFKKTKRAARAKSTQARASTPLAAFDRVRISPLQYSDLPACDCFAP